MGKLTFFILFFIVTLNAQELKFKKYLSDPDNRIDDVFRVNSDLRERVEFWYRIYTELSSHQVIFHDKESYDVIYDIVDYSDIVNSSLHSSTRYNLKHKNINQLISNFRSAFAKLSKGSCNTEKCKKIKSAVTRAGFKLPSRARRKSYWLGFSNNFRAQTGQKEHILTGISNFKDYHKPIDRLFKLFDMPKELHAISFLESSFNIKAESKVGAMGPWQFMKVVGKHFFKIDKNVDQRKAPLLSSSGALFLLKQNKKIMKTWPLAINAYNSGTGLLRRGIRELHKKGIKDPTVSKLIKHFEHPNWGFAAKNFYSEFLALIHTLSYKDKIFGLKFIEPSKDVDFYLTKCKLPMEHLLSTIKSTVYTIEDLNNHLIRRGTKAIYPKGTIVMADVNLTSRKYEKIEFSKLKDYYPKNLWKLVKNQSCSTR